VDGALIFDLDTNTFSTNIPINVTDTGLIEFATGKPALNVLNLAAGAETTVNIAEPAGTPLFTADQVNLNGTLNVQVLDGFTAQPGDTFPIVTTEPDGVNGQWSTWNGPPLANGVILFPDYDPNNAFLQARLATAEVSIL